MEILNKSDQKALAAYTAFVEGHPNGGFMQSVEWTRLKYNWGWEAVISRGKDGKIAGSCLILIRKVPLFGCSLLYAPRGPVCDFYDEAVLRDLLEGAKAVGKKHRGYLFKMDPYVLEDDERFIALARKLGFQFTPHLKDFETIQTRSNYMLDIAGKTEDELLASFHSKWRYNIRVALKHGVECRICDKSALDDFYPIYCETGGRDGFTVRPKEYFARFLDAMGEHARLYICYYQGKPVSGAITTKYAGKTCYVYGASDSSIRKVMPNHLMQWEMIKWGLEDGGTLYDFQGIPVDLSENSPMYGVYKFKKGFNGKIVTFAGEFDYVLNGAMHKMVGAAQNTVDRLHKVQRKLRTRKKLETMHKAFGEGKSQDSAGQNQPADGEKSGSASVKGE